MTARQDGPASTPGTGSGAGNGRGTTAVMAVVTGVVLGVVVVSVAGPWLGTAAADPATETVSILAQPPAAGPSIEAVLTNVRNWIMGIAAAVATVFITVGAIIYMTAGGDLGKVEQAKTAFKSAAYGYAVAVLAPAIVAVLSEIVGAG